MKLTLTKVNIYSILFMFYNSNEPMPETLQLPSSQLPEASPDARLLTLDPARSTWDELQDKGPEGLVGIEWHDENGDLRRISSHDIIHIPKWRRSKSALPRIKWRDQVEGGPYVGRTDKYDQYSEDVDYWTIDVINPDGKLKEVLEYRSYDYPFKPEPVKIFKSVPMEERVKLLNQREEMRHRNELRMYLNEMTGFDEEGDPQPHLSRRISDFRARKMPEVPDTNDIVHIPVPLERSAVKLDAIEAQAERLGRNNLTGLTWTDEDGDIKQIVRQFSAPAKKKFSTVQFGKKLPDKYYVVKTISKKKNYKTGDPVIDEPGNKKNDKSGRKKKRTFPIFGGKIYYPPELPKYEAPEEVIDEVTGEPINETRFMHIYNTESLQTHFTARTRPVHSPAPLDLHWEIPRLRPNERNDTPLIEEEINELDDQELLRRPIALHDWLGRRATQGIPAPAESPGGPYINIDDAFMLLNVAKTYEVGDDRWKVLLDALKNDPKEQKFARSLQQLTYKFGTDNVLGVALGLVENARTAMQQLGLKLRTEQDDLSKVLRDLVMSYYYDEHPDEAEADGFTLTTANPFTYSVSGRQAQREAIDHRVGESFADDVISRQFAEAMVPKEVINPADGKTWTVAAREQIEDFSTNPEVMRMLSESSKAMRDEINELMESAVKTKKNPNAAQYARIGRLMNRVAGN